MQPLTRDHYRKLETAELQRRYSRLQVDTSAMTMEAEMGRMFALQEISEVLIERDALVSA